MTITQDLATLESGDLIRLVELYPEVEYQFRHALIQEAAYQTLVKASRRRLHQAVGESLERLYPDRLASPDLAPVLARHFAEAGDQTRALRYYTLAGRAAAGVYANAEATQHFTLALEIATAQTADPALIVDLFLQLGHALELNAQDAQALKNYEDMETWAKASGDGRAQLAALAARATIYMKPSVEQNLPRGYELSQAALELARALGDQPAEAKVLWNLLNYYAHVWKMREALEVGERALAIARQEGLREQTAYVLTDLFQVYFQLNRPDRGRAALEEARAIWRELDVINMLADNLATTAMLHVAFGEYAQAFDTSREALQISRAIGNLWDQSYAHFIQDLAHFDRGDIGLAIETAEECMRLARQAGFAEGTNQSLFDLVLIYTYMGALSRAFETARPAQAGGEGFKSTAGFSPPAEALPVYVQVHAGNVAEAQAAWDAAPIPKDPAQLRHQFFLTRSFLVQTQAELELAQGHGQHALVLIEDLIAYYAETGVRLFFPDVLAMQGRLLRAAGRLPEAQAALEAARASAESLGSRRSLWPILSELAGLAAGRGEDDDALALRRQAAEIINYIVEHAGSADLRESFRNRPDVRLVLSQAGPT